MPSLASDMFHPTTIWQRSLTILGSQVHFFGHGTRLNPREQTTTSLRTLERCLGRELPGGGGRGRWGLVN